MAQSTSDWISALAKQQAAGSTSHAPKLSLGSLPSGKSLKAASKKKQTPVGWVLDMLTRPVSASRNAISNVVENNIEAAHDTQGKGFGAYAGEAYKKNFLGAHSIEAGVQNGLFSQNAKDHRTTSQLEDKIVGKYNKLNGTDIKINPVVKGVTGFIGDVALDPLTYVPGPDVVKGIKTLREGGKLIADGAEGGLVATAKQASKNVAERDAAKAAARAEAKAAKKATAADVLPDTPPATAVAATELPTAVIKKQIEAPKAAEVKSAQVVKAADKITAPTVKNAAVASGEVAKAAAIAPNKGVIDFLKTLTPDATKTAVKAVSDSSAAAPLDKAAFARELAADPKTPLVVAGKGATEVTKNDLVRVAAGEIEDYTPAELRAVNRVLDQKHADYLGKFGSGQAAGKVVSAGGKDLADSTPAAASETLASQLENYQAKLQANRDAVEQTLGKGATAALSKITDPTKFDKAVEDLNTVAAGQIDGKAAMKLELPARKVAEDMGIITKPARKPKAVPTEAAAEPGDVVVPSIETPATTKTVVSQAAVEVAVAKVPDITPQVQREVATAIGSVFEHHLTEINGAREFATAGQQHLNRALWGIADRYAKQTLKGTRALGNAASELRRTTYTGLFESARQTLEAMGIPVTMGKGADRIPLGFDELLDIVAKHDPKVANVQFNPTGATAPTNLMDAAVALAHGERDPQAIEALIRQSVKSDTGKEVNPILQNTPQLGTDAQLGGKKWTQAQLVSQTAKALLSGADDIESTVARNAGEHAARRSEEALTISDTVLKDINASVENGTVADGVMALLKSPTVGVKNAQDAAHAFDESAQLAEPIVKAALPDVDVASAHAAQSVVDKSVESVKPKRSLAVPDPGEAVTKATSKAAQKKFEAQAAENRANQSEMAAASGVPDETMNFSERFDMDAAAGIAGKAIPFLTRMQHDLGMKTMGPILRSAQVATRTILGRTSSELNALNKLGTDVLTQAMKHIQSGVPATDTPGLQQAIDGLTKQLDTMFDTSAGKTSLLNDATWREGTNIHHLNLNLEALHAFNGGKGALYQFDLDAARAAAKANGTNVIEEVAKQWKSWDIKDPVDFLWQTKRAMLKSQSEQTTAQMFDNIMAQRGLKSSVPKAGYARAIAGEKGSIIARYLDPNGYYDKVYLSEMHAIDSLLKQSTSLNSDFGKFVQNNLDPIMNLWKAGMTIYRPGHHIRNLIGDVSLSFLAGVDNPRSYTKAMRVLGAKGSYKDVDILKALQSKGDFNVPTAGAKISSLALKGGKKIDITADGYYHGAANEGVLPNFHTLEDIAEGDSTLNTMLRKIKPFGGRAEKVAGAASEYRDHYVRLAHFVNFVEKNARKYDNQAQLFEAAGREVRKWHPDGQALTPWERKYARRLIPFYSWQRTAIPLIAESMLTRPGRFLAYPKFQFNLATANGVDQNSLSDPFPDDQMFPEWMTNTDEGPVAKVGGKYYSISPGIANEDVMNDYIGANPIRTIAGSLTPWIKTPIELLTGSSLQTGATIGDTGQYIDQQIPFLNSAASIAGVSPTNSVLQGQTVDNTNITKGNKTAFDPAVVANYLTGIGIKNQSQPNYIKQAQLEARDAAGSGN